MRIISNDIAALACACTLAIGTGLKAQELAKYPPAFIRGVIEGCVDGQKSLLKKQGLEYSKLEDLVREYCYCMAPLTADISSTASGRARILDEDPTITARVKKTEKICLDGIQNGRRFAPSATQPTSYSAKESAYGMIVGTYWSGLAVAEVCSGYRTLRIQAEAASKKYLRVNSEPYERTGRRMMKLASENGGKAAAERLQTEAHQLTAGKEEMLNEARKTASSEARCSTMLANLNNGLWDLERKRSQELRIIFGD